MGDIHPTQQELDIIEILSADRSRQVETISRLQKKLWLVMKELNTQYETVASLENELKGLQQANAYLRNALKASRLEHLDLLVDYDSLEKDYIRLKPPAFFYSGYVKQSFFTWIRSLFPKINAGKQKEKRSARHRAQETTSATR